jgi:uncharacterized delta-60 repeat protein
MMATMRLHLCSYSLACCLVAAACGNVTSDSGDGDGDNTAPEAFAAEVATYRVTPFEGQLEAEDADGDPLHFGIASAPDGGTVEIAGDGWFRYVSAHGTSGADSFEFVVDDGKGGTAVATVDVSIADLTDGTPDAEFGDGGAAISDYGNADSLGGVIIADGGRIMAAGTSGGNWAVLAGYSTRGTLLSSWGEGGSGTTMLGLGDYDAFGDLVQQPNGRVVSVGQTLDAGNYNFMLLGVTPDNGYLDTSFNGGGVVVTDVAAGQADVANAVALLPDGRFLVAGYASNGANNDFLVARYGEDGTLDDTFGTGGSTLVDFGAFEGVDDIAIDQAGNILLVGEVDHDMGVARLTPEGDLDAGFGDGGKVRLDRGENDKATAVAIGPDGAVYVGGSSQSGGVWSMAVIRLTEAGALDETFGESGWGLATAESADVSANAMLVLPNQMLLLVGSWTADAVTEAAAARIDLSGAHDTGFGEGGFYHQALGTGGDSALFAAALQEDGKVVAAGYAKNANVDALLVRLGW